MKKLTLITLATLALLGTQSTQATDLSKDEYITQLENKIQRLEEQKFALPEDVSDDTIDYYAAYNILKAYNGLEYDENITWTVNDNSITIDLNN